MRIRKLREIEKHILENPLRLYMANWIVRQKDSRSEGPRPNTYPECGTAGCIAGWTCLLNGKKRLREGIKIRRMAEKILGLTRAQATRLFIPDNWPWDYRDGRRDDGTAHTAKVAVDRIEHFIKTKGRE